LVVVVPELQSGSGTGAFSGSIDTWNNPPSGTGASDRAPGAAAPGAGTAASVVAGAPAGKRTARNSGGKDAFDNAGNWGDDFPPADDWDNEEYTGSLSETKVFSARSNVGPAGGKPAAAGRPQDLAQQPQQPQPAAANATVIGPNRSFSATVNGPPAASATPAAPPTSSYSQSIDLSTLMQKPATQSTLSSPPLQQQPQQSLLQFNQQATDTLRANLGLSGGQTGSSKAPGNLNSYSYNSASAFSATNPSANSYVGQGSAFTSIKPTSQQSPASGGSPSGPAGLGLQQRSQGPPQPSKGSPAASLGMSSSAVSSTQMRSRMPPASKIPTSAVEMPGDSVTQLDVQFGGLDLKFGSTAGIGIPSVSMPSSAALSAGMPLASSSAPMPTSSSTGLQSNSSVPSVSLPSTGLPSVTMPSKQISNGYPNAGMPKSTSSSASSSAAIKPGQQVNSDSIGSYGGYGSYGQPQSKPSYHHQYQNQYGGYSDQNSYQSSSNSGYGSQNSYSSSSTPSSGYKMPSAGGSQYQVAIK
jgi:hypothetical protein